MSTQSSSTLIPGLGSLEKGHLQRLCSTGLCKALKYPCRALPASTSSSDPQRTAPLCYRLWERMVRLCWKLLAGNEPQAGFPFPVSIGVCWTQMDGADLQFGKRGSRSSTPPTVGVVAPLLPASSSHRWGKPALQEPLGTVYRSQSR